ncbi:unnamed protein product [Diamesa serratosioi]
MELKVWVENIQRIVCGVTETTTCQDVVFALAHATGKTGRFTLIERWKNKNERFLAPNENPLKILMKWGEFSSDVQFILQRSDKQQLPLTQANQPLVRQQQKNTNNLDEFGAHKEENKVDNSEQTMNSDKDDENSSDQKSIPQQQQKLNISAGKDNSLEASESGNIMKNLDYSSIDRKLAMNAKRSNEHLLEMQNQRNYHATVNSTSSSYSNTSTSPIIGTSGSLNPPPYRNPPPPRTSPNHKSIELYSNTNHALVNNIAEEINDVFMKNSQYRDLMQLIKYQREKLTTQQSDLTKFDAEIVYFESKGLDKMQQIEAIAQELNKTDQIFWHGNEQLQTLQYVDEENELVVQQGKTLKSEITLLRSKLANCETELLQCKNKIRILMDELQMEQRNFSRQFENRQQLERHLMGEVDRLQADIDLAISSSEDNIQTADGLKKEVAMIESSISEKKNHLEKLVQEMKEVNLKSLTVTQTDEVKKENFLEGSKSGSSRRIIGSPRQLENAVPTSKNPHGVWV